MSPPESGFPGSTAGGMVDGVETAEALTEGGETGVELPGPLTIEDGLSTPGILAGGCGDVEMETGVDGVVDVTPDDVRDAIKMLEDVSADDFSLHEP